MKKLFKIIILSLVVFSFAGCNSTKVNPEKLIAENTPTVKALENEEVIVDEQEYVNSTKKLNEGETVSKGQFAKDKAEILKLVKELQVIMDTKNYEAWLDYIAPSSKKFYSSPRKINDKGKTKILNGLEDYFLMVFIPSRQKAQVQQIRYISPTSIKAVDVSERPKIVTYYNFVKLNDKWYVELPNITIR